MAPYNAVEATKIMTASFEYLRETPIPNPKRNKEWTEVLLHKTLKKLMGMANKRWNYFRKLALQGRFVLTCLQVIVLNW